MHKMVKSMGDRFPAKALAIMKITDVYECKSGSEAGKKLI
jgi:predicted pyridoxine 5'-phosphate oxidase superfamily flavin-nucleotide-binding protein